MLSECNPLLYDAMQVSQEILESINGLKNVFILILPHGDTAQSTDNILHTTVVSVLGFNCWDII